MPSAVGFEVHELHVDMVQAGEVRKQVNVFVSGVTKLQPQYKGSPSYGFNVNSGVD